MINVFDYTDYSTFLEDYFKEKKTSNPNFSYQFFAEKAGFSNKGFVYNLVKGKRSLSKSNLFKMCQALGFNGYEAEYFENLVSFNQVNGIKEKNHYFERINTINNKGRVKSRMQVVRKDQYEYYSIWYHSAIRSIIDMGDFRGDFKWLARMVYPQISTKEAKLSVELLCKLGMVENKNGTYSVTEKNITTGKDLVNLAIQKFHIQCADLSKRALQELPKDERNVTGLTLGISRSTYEKICEEILKFQDLIAEMVDKDNNCDQAYQLNFNFYPVSKKLTKEL